MGNVNNRSFRNLSDIEKDIENLEKVKIDFDNIRERNTLSSQLKEMDIKLKELTKRLSVIPNKG